MKYLLVDINGTITRPKNGKEFVSNDDPTAIELIEGVAEALQQYEQDGWMIVGVSNQGGIAAGHRSHESVQQELVETMKLAPQIIKILYCPDFEGTDLYQVNGSRANYPLGSHYQSNRLTGFWEVSEFSGTFRKPQPGMLLAAVKLGVKANKVLMIGDREEDQTAAAAAGFEFQWAKDWIKHFVDKLERLTPAVDFLEGKTLDRYGYWEDEV